MVLNCRMSYTFFNMSHFNNQLLKYGPVNIVFFTLAIRPRPSEANLLKILWYWHRKFHVFTDSTCK